jgi:hypothetical protein
MAKPMKSNKRIKPISHHAEIRSVQRFGSQLGPQDSSHILRAIRSGFQSSKEYEDMRNGNVCWAIIYRGQSMRVVTDKNVRTIVTVLPQ